MQGEAMTNTHRTMGAGRTARVAASRAASPPTASVAALSGAAFAFPGLLLVVVRLITGRVLVVRTRNSIGRQAAH